MTSAGSISGSAVPPYEPVSVLENIRISANTKLKENPLTILFWGVVWIMASEVYSRNRDESVTNDFMATTCFITGWGLILTVLCVWRKHIRSVTTDRIEQKMGSHPSLGMGARIYHERACKLRNNIIAQLAYEKDRYHHQIPVLTFSANLPPAERGFAQGYLLGEQTIEIFREVLRPFFKLAQIKCKDHGGVELQKTFKTLKIPESYLTEMENFIKGVHAYADDIHLHVDDAIPTSEEFQKLHCFADCYSNLHNKSIINKTLPYSIGMSFLGGLPDLVCGDPFDVGCSTLVVKTDGGCWVGRNLDLFSYRQLGQKYLVTREEKNGKIIESGLFPGLIGALTVIIKDPVSLNNELVLIYHNLGTTKHPGGTPNLLFMRRLSEEAQTIDDVQRLIDGGLLPGASAHLIVVDGQRALNYQFFPSGEKIYILRELKDNALIVTNDYRDPETDELLPDREDGTESSKTRFKAIQDTLEEYSDKQPRIRVCRSMVAAQENSTIATEIIHIPFGGGDQFETQRVFDGLNAANNLYKYGHGRPKTPLERMLERLDGIF